MVYSALAQLLPHFSAGPQGTLFLLRSTDIKTSINKELDCSQTVTELTHCVHTLLSEDCNIATGCSKCFPSMCRHFPVLETVSAFSELTSSKDWARPLTIWLGREG